MVWTVWNDSVLIERTAWSVTTKGGAIWERERKKMVIIACQHWNQADTGTEIVAVVATIRGFRAAVADRHIWRPHGPFRIHARALASATRLSPTRPRRPRPLCPFLNPHRRNPSSSMPWSTRRARSGASSGASKTTRIGSWRLIPSASSIALRFLLRRPCQWLLPARLWIRPRRMRRRCAFSTAPRRRRSPRG